MTASPTEIPFHMSRTRMQGYSHRLKSLAPRQNDALEGRKTLSYFLQVLDVDTVCNNALRKLKEDIANDTSISEQLSQDDWRYSFSVPINTKY